MFDFGLSHTTYKGLGHCFVHYHSPGALVVAILVVHRVNCVGTLQAPFVRTAPHVAHVTRHRVPDAAVARGRTWRPKTRDRPDGVLGLDRAELSARTTRARVVVGPECGARKRSGRGVTTDGGARAGGTRGVWRMGWGGGRLRRRRLLSGGEIINQV